jgi:TfoX/Sxy family transcriptional regulator of competence genes
MRETGKSDMVGRVRQAMTDCGISEVEEKKMFGGIAFMVRGLMCVTARPERIMCRIDPETHDEAVSRKGCSAMEMKGRVYRGYVFVAADALKSERELMFWVEKALTQNRSLVEAHPPKTPAKKRTAKKQSAKRIKKK